MVQARNVRGKRCVEAGWYGAGSHGTGISNEKGICKWESVVAGTWVAVSGKAFSRADRSQLTLLDSFSWCTILSPRFCNA